MTVTTCCWAQLSFDVKCHISTAFVTVQLSCYLPREWPGVPMEIVLPKSTHTTITELLVDNLVGAVQLQYKKLYSCSTQCSTMLYMSVLSHTIA